MILVLRILAKEPLYVLYPAALLLDPAEAGGAGKHLDYTKLVSGLPVARSGVPAQLLPFGFELLFSH